MDTIGIITLGQTLRPNLVWGKTLAAIAMISPTARYSIAPFL
jgi:hypothetical protein